MKMKGTTELTPGMTVGKDVYSDAGLLVLSAGDIISEDAVSKLHAHKVNFIFVKEPEDENMPPEKKAGEYLDPDRPSYNERLKESMNFKVFKKKYDEEAFALRKLYGDIIAGNLKEDLMVSTGRIVKGLEGAMGEESAMDLTGAMKESSDATFAHALNVSMIAIQLAVWLKFSPDDIDLAGTCGLLYDIGKVTIPSNILDSPRKLTDEQYNIVKQHPETGYNILSRVINNEHVLNAALEHHEKFDGSGYPKGLKGNEIDKFARLIAIADSYDAITSQRSYRVDQSPFQVAEIFEIEGYQKYDTGYIMTFLQHMVKGYVGDWCILSDGRKGKIIMINPNSLSRPVVAIEDQFVDLSKNKNLYIAKIV